VRGRCLLVAFVVLAAACVPALAQQPQASPAPPPAAAKTQDVRPVYPDVALKARVQGVVICEVLVGPDGRVKDVHVLRSIPLLDQAAVDAVRQWEFTTTLRNGDPVSIVMTVTVNFTLQ